MSKPRHLYIGTVRPTTGSDAGTGTVCEDTPEYDYAAHGFLDTLYISQTTCIPCLVRITTVVEGLLVSLGYKELGEKVDTPSTEE